MSSPYVNGQVEVLSMKSKKDGKGKDGGKKKR
jgi:hypothetical protein